MNESVIECRPGDTVNLDWFLYSGSGPTTGATEYVTIQQESDGYYLKKDGTTWLASFDGTYANANATVNLLTELTGNIHLEGVYRYPFVVPGQTAGQVANAIYNAAVKYAIGASYGYLKRSIIAVPYQYAAMVEMRASSVEAKDRWVVRWFKDLISQTSITSPTLTVKDRADGSTLISAVSMTDVGSGQLLYTATGAERTTKGHEYEATVTATINGATRTWVMPIGRDI